MIDKMAKMSALEELLSMLTGLEKDKMMSKPKMISVEIEAKGEPSEEESMMEDKPLDLMAMGEESPEPMMADRGPSMEESMGRENLDREEMDPSADRLRRLIRGKGRR